MCNSGYHSFLTSLPKCEHHMHLEGALSPNVLFSLAARNNITLPTDDSAYSSVEFLNTRYQNFTSLDDFLHYYYIGMSVLIHASDFEDLAWDYFQRASRQGVMHAEVFFDPQAHVSRGVSYDTVLAGFSAARVRAEKELGLSSLLICCFLRHLPVSECVAMFEHQAVQRSLKDGSVVGIGLDSSEANFPPELFKQIYDGAGKLGVRRTAHAGEEGPPEFVRNALDVLGVERIDHGVRIAEDEALMERIAREKIMLSVCPLSNRCLSGVKEIKELPIRTFLDKGVRFSINSDDPAYFGGYILENYCAVQEAFGLKLKDWRTICEAAIEGSWCGGERKTGMKKRLEEVLDQWKGRIA